jgi:drug/metabolite transporter (DMT)-like permease
MNGSIIAALAATAGFAIGDVFTALFARKVSGKASMVLLTGLRLLLYAPLMLLWHNEFRALTLPSIAWIALLGVLFTIAYLGFNLAMGAGKNPALVGVVAGSFPASASFVAIVFLGQRPTLFTIGLLIAVLCGVVLIGLPENWRQSLKLDKGVALALLPLVCWGVFGALLNKPVGILGTSHAWFVVQSLVVVIMVVISSALYNRHISGFLKETSRLQAWKLVIPAGIIIGLAEASQALSLGSGKQLVIIETILGSYPAVYFLIANKIFKEPLHARQGFGIAITAIAVILLSTGITKS